MAGSFSSCLSSCLFPASSLAPLLSTSRILAPFSGATLPTTPFLAFLASVSASSRSSSTTSTGFIDEFLPGMICEIHRSMESFVVACKSGSRCPFGDWAQWRRGGRAKYAGEFGIGDDVPIFENNRQFLSMQESPVGKVSHGCCRVCLFLSPKSS